MSLPAAPFPAIPCGPVCSQGCFGRLSIARGGGRNAAAGHPIRTVRRLPYGSLAHSAAVPTPATG